MDKIAEMSKLKKEKVERLSSGKINYVNKTGDPIVGTTTISGRFPAFLLPWANNLGLKGEDNEAYLRHSGNVGAVFHLQAESFFRAEKYSRPEAWETHKDIQEYELLADVCYSKLMNFVKDFPDFEPLMAEAVMVSDKHQYGGMIDLIALIKGKRVLIDLKSTNGIFPSHKIQVAGAYNKLCEENELNIDTVMILRCSRDPADPYQKEVISDCGFWFDEFLPLLQSYEAQQIHSIHRKTKEYKDQRKLDKTFWTA